MAVSKVLATASVNGLNFPKPQVHLASAQLRCKQQDCDASFSDLHHTCHLSHPTAFSMHLTCSSHTELTFAGLSNQMQDLTSYLHDQLQQHGADAPELWIRSEANMHIIMRTTHQAGKTHLLAMLSILSVHIHRASVAILFPSKDAQQHFSHHADTLQAQAQQAMIQPKQTPPVASPLGHQSANTQTPSATEAIHGFMLHEEQLTLDCGSHVTVMSSPASLPEEDASYDDSHHHQAHADKCPQRFVLCLADHDLCTSDAQLLRFWTHLQWQQQQQQQQTVGQEQNQAVKSATMLLSKPFGHLGSLWQIISMTYSLPGLASCLTGSQEPGFSTHLIQTHMPKGCRAHPLMLPEEEDQEVSSVQRRIAPLSAAVAVQQEQDKKRNASQATWYGLHPSLLQWLSSLTETAASSPKLPADPKMIMAVGAPQLPSVDHIIDHAEASGLLLTVLELESGMLTASPDCLTSVASALDTTMLAPHTKGQQTSKHLHRFCAPKLVLSGHTLPAKKVSAVCAASASAAAAVEKPIHGIVLLSWEMLQRLGVFEPTHAVTDLYLCDLAEAVAPDSTAPLSHMAACSLHAVTRHLCGAFPRWILLE